MTHTETCEPMVTYAAPVDVVQSDSAVKSSLWTVTEKGYCGPVVVSALTGVPVSRVEAMIRRGRRGGYRDANGRRMPIRGTHPWEIKRVLEKLGCKVTRMKDPESTFGRFVKDVAHINGAFLVEVTGHFMATSKGLFCDASYKHPTPVEGYHNANRRVLTAWRVEAPIVPKYTEDVIPKKREAKPKPSIREVRAARVAVRLKEWQTKLKRAQTAVKKLQAQAKYYGIEAPHRALLAGRRCGLRRDNDTLFTVGERRQPRPDKARLFFVLGSKFALLS